MFFLDGSKGWVGGSHGLIATYDFIVNVRENEFVPDDISVTPNPASDKILISTVDDKIVEILSIYDLSGKLIMQTENMKNIPDYTIDVSKYSPGTYILQIKCDGKTSTKKLVKK
jgi:hypothetical protein